MEAVLQDHLNKRCCPTESVLLQEDGFNLLQEDNSNILIL